MTGDADLRVDRRAPRVGDVIHNPVQGETMRFLNIGDNGADPVLRVEMTVQPQASGPPPHIHPGATETFSVRTGAIRLRAGGDDRVVSAGEAVAVEPGTRHTFYNHTDQTAVVVTEWDPALSMARFLDKWFELARSGQFNKKGMPPLLQVAVLFDAYLEAIALPGIPLELQRPLGRVVSRLGRLRGYTAG